MIYNNGSSNIIQYANRITIFLTGLVSEILSYILTKGSEDQGLLPSISDDPSMQSTHTIFI